MDNTRQSTTWLNSRRTHLSVFMCLHLIQPSPDSCCKLPPCSTYSQMGRCSVSQEGGWGWCLCTCKYKRKCWTLERHSSDSPSQPLNSVIHVQVCQEANSPEKGVLQVQEVAGLWSCLVHLGNNTDVVALSGEKETSFSLKSIQIK